MKTSFQISVVICLTLFSCNPPPVDNQQAIMEEIENRVIKRVTKSQIMEEAMKQGDLISSISQQTLSKALASAIQSGGIPSALEQCNLSAYPLIDSLSKVYEAKIRRVSLKLRNPLDAPDSIENDILEAYEYANQNSLELLPNIEEISDDAVLYTQPIRIANPMCLNCHGKLGQELSPANHETILSLYPTDSAIGYSAGDFRGMWSIRFLKRNLIKSID